MAGALSQLTATSIYKIILDSMTEEQQESFRSFASTKDFESLEQDFQSGALPSRLFISKLRDLLNEFIDQLDPDDILHFGSRYAFWNPICASLLTMYIQYKRPAKRKINTLPDRSEPSQKQCKLSDNLQVLTGDLGDTRKAIYISILSHLRSAKFVFDGLPGCSHIKCRTENCQFCSNLYKGMKISQCTAYKHPACIPGCGWFPHVGPDLWATLQSRHDSGREFVIKLREVGDSYLPPLQTYLNNLDLKKTFVSASLSSH